MKIKVKILTGIMAAILATSAYAGIKTKKAIRDAEEGSAVELQKAKEACGNEELSVTFDWDVINKAVDEREDELIAGTIYTEGNTQRHVGQRTMMTFEAMVELCKDPDYKQELQKLKQITISGLPNVMSDIHSEFELVDEETLIIKSGYRYTKRVKHFIKLFEGIY